MISNSFDAEYGRNSGAVVNVVTKSGTNNIHGSFYEFFRNDVLNAHPFTFFAAPKPDFKQNQFGGTIGGPIKKDKTFFFGSYEGRRIIQGIVSQPISVPTAAELNNGDFSANGIANGVVDPNGNSRFCRILIRCDRREYPGKPLRSKSELPPANGGRPICEQRRRSAALQHDFSELQDPHAVFRPCGSQLTAICSWSGRKWRSASHAEQNGPRRPVPDSRRPQLVEQSENLRSTIISITTTRSIPFAKFQASGATTGNFPGDYATRTQQLNITHTSTIGSTAVNEFRFSYFREGQLMFDSPTRTNAIQASCGTGAAAAFCFTGTSDTPLAG